MENTIMTEKIARRGVKTPDSYEPDPLEKIKAETVPEDELTKVKNKTESTMIFSEMSLLDKAMNLAYFELLGDADGLNHETEKFLQVTAEQIKAEANKLFRKDNSSTLIYLAE